MVKKLLSTLVVGACCMQAASFNPGPSPQSHVRLDLEVDPTNPSKPYTSIITARRPPLGAVEEDSKAFEECNNSNLRDLPPVLQQITDERRNFQMNLGKAMDTLRKDMPYILKQTPGTHAFCDKLRRLIGRKSNLGEIRGIYVLSFLIQTSLVIVALLLSMPRTNPTLFTSQTTVFITMTSR